MATGQERSKSFLDSLLHPRTRFGENIRTFGFALLIVMIFRSSIAAPYRIPTGSMIPTLKIGDHIFVSKLSYGLKLPFTNYNLTVWNRPERGDIIVFKYPVEPSIDYIKRVVGVPGDKVEIREGQIFINGELVERAALSRQELMRDVEAARDYPEEYLLFRERLDEVEHPILHNRYYLTLFHNYGPVEIGEEEYFVMGDNRDNSKDSREWGLVPFDNIRGRALAVFFSVRRWPFDIRWGRFGNVIR